MENGEIPWDDEPEDVHVSREAIADAVVTDTDWTAETILSQLRRGNIQLNPRFQRRDAWDQRRKAKFIESLILGYPIPQIVLAENKRRKGAFIVLDGKQRLLTLRQFAEGSSLSAGTPENEFRKLALHGLDIRPDLHGYNLAKLENDLDKVNDLNALLNQTIRTVVVRRWPNDDFLNDVFLRLNTGSVSLSPQELRQALHPGDFTDFIDDFTLESRPVRQLLRRRSPDFRMRDVELLLRYCANQLFLPSYRGNLKAFLDDSLNRLNDDWVDHEDEIRDLARSFNESIEAIFAIFKEHAFFRWDSTLGRYERRFNRAVFDVLMYYFRDDSIRELARSKAADVEEAFISLCTNDAEFVKYVQATTKSLSATFGRMQKWSHALGAALDQELPAPEPAGESQNHA